MNRKFAESLHGEVVFFSGALLAGLILMPETALLRGAAAVAVLAGLIWLPGGRRILFVLTLAATALVWQFRSGSAQPMPFSGENKVYRLELDDMLLTGVESIGNPKLICGRWNRTPVFLTGKDLPLLRCGDQVEVRGRIFAPSSPVTKKVARDGTVQWLEGSYAVTDFDDYLLHTRRAGILRAESIRILKRKTTFCSRIADGRDWLLRRTLSNLPGDEAKKLAATLFFGCRQAFPQEQRMTLSRSGTMHLIALSGFHVGIALLLLLPLLRLLPRKLNLAAVIVFLLIYAAATGANPPVMRAVIVVGVLAWMRIFLRGTSFLLLLLTAAGILLIWNPFYLMDAGFQLSFLITGILVLGVRKIQQWRRLFPIGRQFQTRGSRGVLHAFLLERAAAGTAAFLGVFLFGFVGGCMLGLRHFGTLLPGSILTNILLWPVTMACFFMLPFKWLFSFSHCCDLLLGKILGGLLNGFLRIAEFGCAVFPPLPAIRPGIWLVLLFYAALVIALMTRGRKAIAGGLLASGIFAAVVLSAIFAKERNILLLQENRVSAALFPAGRYEMLAVNPSSREAVEAMHRLALAQGSIRCRVILSEHDAQIGRALELLRQKLPVAEVITLPIDKRKRRLRTVLAQVAQGDGIGYTEGTGEAWFCRGDLAIRQNGDILQLSSGNFSLQIAKSNAGVEVREKAGGKRFFCFSNQLQVVEL
ncbi:MAG: ComEC/Rec2 family competence protein [Victivallaceae bacterium]|nr:ComEC/Rec2 family competence protein [Victivallaceae bacterium]